MWQTEVKKKLQIEPDQDQQEDGSGLDPNCPISQDPQNIDQQMSRKYCRLHHDQDQQKVCPDLDPNCPISHVFHKYNQQL